MADFEPGKMDITDQEESYGAFTRMLYRTSILIAVVLLAMYFFLT